MNKFKYILTFQNFYQKYFFNLPKRKRGGEKPKTE